MLGARRAPAMIRWQGDVNLTFAAIKIFGPESIAEILG